MKKYGRISIILSIITSALAVVSVAIAIISYLNKNDEELERYLDCSIQ